MIIGNLTDKQHRDIIIFSVYNFIYQMNNHGTQYCLTCSSMPLRLIF